jgi:hypothetical protein
MNLDNNKFLGSTLGIQSIPTFLFVHKGSVVKKQSGADKSALTTNIKWMIDTYNLSAGGNSGQTMTAPVQKKTLQVYSEKPSPFYFEAEKWDLPLKKLKEFATKHKYPERPAFGQLEDMLHPNFVSSTEDHKKLVIDYAIEAIPVDIPDDAVPFLDFFRICLLKEDLTRYA